MPGLETRDQVIFPVWVKGKKLQVEYYRRTSRKYGGHYYRPPKVKWKGAPLSLHKAVWESTRGLKMPKGYCIHHIDEYPAHNEGKNLKCMRIEEHRKWHSKIREMLDEVLKYKKRGKRWKYNK